MKTPCCRPAWLEPPVRFDAGQRCRGLSEQPRNRGCCVGETSRMKDGRLDGPSDEDRRWPPSSASSSSMASVSDGSDLGFAQGGYLAHGSRLLVSRDQGPELVLATPTRGRLVDLR